MKLHRDEIYKYRDFDGMYTIKHYLYKKYQWKNKSRGGNV